MNEGVKYILNSLAVVLIAIIFASIDLKYFK